MTVKRSAFMRGTEEASSHPMFDMSIYNIHEVEQIDNIALRIENSLNRIDQSMELIATESH